ncbi:MAG: putative ATPase/DNA-binding SARP family transcriptional activator [Candidatus Aldehydirespiratoraceae bacterium]|jgi:predicted ATPase/DNA-binding SARP family transcriptional activator
MLRVLGEVEIDGQGPLRSAAQRVLLAVLVLDRGQVVSSEKIAEHVWGDDQPVNPVASLQNHVSRLRRLLPDELAIVAIGSGYRLEAPNSAIDLVRFESLFESASAADPGSRLDEVDAALSLWSGPPFTGLDDPYAASERLRLEEMRHSLRDLHAEELVGAGRIPEAIAELEAIRAIDPFRETTIHTLMTARFLAGDQTRALATYTKFRESLVEEFGLEPGERLRSLESSIIVGDLEPLVVQSALESVDRRPDPLPRPVSTFHGRATEMGALAAALDADRIVTLVGPGGVGKTRLAVETLAPLSGDEPVVFIELAALSDESRVAEYVANALKVSSHGDVPWADRIVQTLTGRSLILVLDNCEHLINGVAVLAEAMIQGVAGLRIVATSREPLNIDGERVHRLTPLDADADAVDLFVDRATMSDSQFSLDGEGRAVAAHICRELDGLPLAIELAAARMSTMTIEQVSAGLDERLSLLSQGRRNAAERHQSLRALVEWSLRDLAPDLLSVLLETSVFAGSFDALAARAVATSAQPDVVDALRDLTDRSLLLEQRVSGRPTKYRFLATIRHVAREALAKDGTADAAQDRHGAWVLGMIEASRLSYASADEVAHVGALLDIHDEIRLAHQKFCADADANAALELANGLHYVASFYGSGEMFGWIMEAADRFGDEAEEQAESVLYSASIGAWHSGDLDRATHYAEWAGRVAETSTADGAGRGAASAIADVIGFLGDVKGSRTQYLKAIGISRTMAEGERLITDLTDYAMVAAYDNELEKADVALTEARSLTAPGTLFRAWVDYSEGEAFAESDPERAFPALAAAIDVAVEREAQFIAGVSALTFCGLQIRHRDPRAAIPTLVERLAYWRESGAWVQLWIAARTVVDLLVRLEQFGEAALLMKAIDASGSFDATEPSADVVRLTAAADAIREALGVDALDQAAGESVNGEVAVDRVIEYLRTVDLAAA